MHRRLEDRDEVAEGFASEGVYVAHKRFQVNKVVIGFHPRLRNFLAQTVECREVGAFGHLRPVTSWQVC